jgi:hypothetical protein
MSASLKQSRASSGTGTAYKLCAGGAQVGATNTNGGNLTMSSGVSTGSGVSAVHLQVPAAGASGTADNSLVDRYVSSSRKSITTTAATAAALFTMSLASGTNGGGTVHWTVDTTNGTNQGVHTGVSTFAAANVGGTITSGVNTGLQVNVQTAGTLVSAPLLSITTGSGLITVNIVTPSYLLFTPTSVHATYAVQNVNDQLITPV